MAGSKLRKSEFPPGQVLKHQIGVFPSDDVLRIEKNAGEHREREGRKGDRGQELMPDGRFIRSQGVAHERMLLILPRYVARKPANLIATPLGRRIRCGAICT